VPLFFPNKWLAFRNYNRKERLPFILYADLECTLEKQEGQDRTTYAYQHHKAFSVGYYVNCAYDSSLSSFKFYRGDDRIAWFVDQLHDLARHVKTIITAVVPMTDLTQEESEQFRSAAKCHVCEKPVPKTRGCAIIATSPAATEVPRTLVVQSKL